SVWRLGRGATWSPTRWGVSKQSFEDVRSQTGVWERGQRGHRRGGAYRNRVSRTCVPKQEFGNEGNRLINGCMIPILDAVRASATKQARSGGRPGLRGQNGRATSCCP